MLFFTAFLWYLVKFIFLAGIVTGGVFAGIWLRKRKNTKE